MTAFAPGMRVVVADGNWEGNMPRMAGHYGKVTCVLPYPDEDDPPIHVAITGHVDGQPPEDLTEFEWYWPEELAVID